MRRAPYRDAPSPSMCTSAADRLIGVQREAHGSAHTHHAAPDHGGHHATHADMFRARFWWCLLLTVPVVVTSPMVMAWFGYQLGFAGIDAIGPVLGSVIYFWGGWVFLS